MLTALLLSSGVSAQTTSTEILGLVTDTSGAVVTGALVTITRPATQQNFNLPERFKLQFRGELFNALNTPFFGQPNNLGFVSATSVVPDGPRVGEIRSLRTAMRIIQFGLKLYF